MRPKITQNKSRGSSPSSSSSSAAAGSNVVVVPAVLGFFCVFSNREEEDVCMQTTTPLEGGVISIILRHSGTRGVRNWVEGFHFTVHDVLLDGKIIYCVAASRAGGIDWGYSLMIGIHFKYFRDRERPPEPQRLMRDGGVIYRLVGCSTCSGVLTPERSHVCLGCVTIWMVGSCKCSFIQFFNSI